MHDYHQVARLAWDAIKEKHPIAFGLWSLWNRNKYAAQYNLDLIARVAEQWNLSNDEKSIGRVLEDESIGAHRKERKAYINPEYILWGVPYVTYGRDVEAVLAMYDGMKQPDQGLSPGQAETLTIEFLKLCGKYPLGTKLPSLDGEVTNTFNEMLRELKATKEFDKSLADISDTVRDTINQYQI